MHVRTSLLIMLFSCMLLSSEVGASETSYEIHSYYHGGYLAESGSAVAMVADTLIARPIGIVATVGGSAVYIVALPFSFMGGNEKQVREKLVNEPAAFTFKRPLGEFPSLD